MRTPEEPLEITAERDPAPSDFVGKTIKCVDTSACNVWKFYFVDGTAIAIEANVFGEMPVMQVCEECVLCAPAVAE